MPDTPSSVVGSKMKKKVGRQRVAIFRQTGADFRQRRLWNFNFAHKFPQMRDF